MSTNLFWRPIDSGQCLSKELKYILTNSGFVKNGPDKLNYGDVPLLMGIRTASGDNEVKEECTLLIDAIEKYNEIEIYIE